MSEPKPMSELPELWTWDDAPQRLDEHWSRGGVVAIPTESSYGLAVDPANSRAVETVLRIKRRGAGLALPVVAGRLSDLEALGVRLDEPVLEPAITAWPAALTLVVPCPVALPASCGLPTLAVRVPGHAALRRLLASLGRAVTATSANRTSEPPATTPAEVSELLRGEGAIVIDDGVLPGGPPSTLLSIREGRLHVLRDGRYPWERAIGD